MNTLRNSVKLIGHIGQDPEVRTLDKGTKVATFSLATNDSYTDKEGNKQTQTQWHNITAWEKLAERAEKYLKKGMEIAVEGHIAYRNWEDKNGVKHTACDIVIDDFLMFGSAK